MTIPWQSLLAGTVGWFVLSSGDVGSWLIGAPVVVVIAVAVSRWRPERAHPVHWRAVPQFLAFFLSRSLVAGVDVARRTLSPAMPLAPAVLMYRTQLPAGAPRVLFSGTISLLPGSLGVLVEDDQVTVHVLDRTQDVEGDLQRVERRIAAMFGQVLT